MKKKLVSLCCTALSLFALNQVSFAQNQTTPTNNVQNKSPLGLQIRPNLIGLWQLKPYNSQCIEYYNFQENEQLVVNSGQEWVLAHYHYQYPEHHQESLPILHLSMLYDNNEMDCSGSKEDQTHEETAHFIKWNTPHQFELCNKEDGTSCWVQLNRILP